MIDQLEKLRDIDDEVFETVKESTEYLTWLLKESPIPRTSELFWMYITSTNFIKNSIFDCSENEDIYSVKILFRALLEHYFRFQFVFFKYGLIKSDAYSEKYVTILEISEFLNSLKSINAANSIQGFEGLEISKMWSELCERFPKLKKYSKKEVESWVKEISIRNIIRFIDNELLKTNSSNNVLSSKIILEYSDLSPYVHGGVLAFKTNMSHGDEKIRHKELLRISSLSLHVTTAIKLFSYLTFFQYNKGFKDIYLKTDFLIKQII